MNLKGNFQIKILLKALKNLNSHPDFYQNIVIRDFFHSPSIELVCHAEETEYRVVINVRAQGVLTGLLQVVQFVAVGEQHQIGQLIGRQFCRLEASAVQVLEEGGKQHAGRVVHQDLAVDGLAHSREESASEPVATCSDHHTMRLECVHLRVRPIRTASLAAVG
jgi:hypothetical protein